MLTVSVLFEVDPEHVDAFRVGVLQHAKNSLANEQACRRFDVCVDPENANRFFLYECYDDEAAFAVHKQADYFAKFGAMIEPWVTSKELNVWHLTSSAAADPV